MLLGGIVLAAALLSVCLGAVWLTPGEILQALFGKESSTASHIILYVRLPRTLGCLLAGAALAVSGAIIQSVLNNPLAAPNIIGVNSGAGLMVALFCAVAPTAVAAVPIAAFIGAFAGVLLVLAISQRAGASRITLVLAGVAISGSFSAGIDAILTFFPDSAQSLGLPVKRVRILLLGLAAALAGAAVSFSGLLGFVGLIVPHIMRRLMGSESKCLLSGCALGGAALLTLCDIGARVLFAPYELPVGILLSLCGGPFFLWLLFRKKGVAHP